VKRWQLRMYRVQHGRMDDWLGEWRAHIQPLRESMGFEVLGPWVGEDDRFVWMIGHDDLESADAAYYASPVRMALDPDPARLLADVQTFLLEDR
jgi:NIPSNAP